MIPEEILNISVFYTVQHILQTIFSSIDTPGSHNISFNSSPDLHMQSALVSRKENVRCLRCCASQ